MKLEPDDQFIHNETALKRIIVNHQLWLEDNRIGETISLYKYKFQYCNLSFLDLRFAEFKECLFWHSNLNYSILAGANFSGSKFHGVSLHGADLRYADLNETIFVDSHLEYADFSEAILPKFQPPDGDLICYKKCMSIKNGGADKPVIVKLMIPATARRTGVLGYNHHRAEYALVLEIDNKIKCAESMYGHSFPGGNSIYKPGEFVHPNGYDGDFTKMLAPGIHFFLTRKEAEDFR